MSGDLTGITATLRRLAHRASLPSGTVPVAVGYAVSGLTAYAFLAITSRALGPVRYAPVSVLWTLVFVAVPGLFLPLEQEVTRAISSRRVLGIGARSVVARAGAAGVAVALVVAVAALAASGPIVSRLFDGSGLLLGGFVVAVALYVAYYLARGVLAGSGEFGVYGVLLSAEGLARLAVVAGLAVVGVKAAGAYGLAVGLPVIAGVVAGMGLHRRSLGGGPVAPWGEIFHAVGMLVAGALLGQSLINAGPIVVKLLSGPSEQAAAGTFLNGLVMARIPLYFFQAVQASLLPSLSANVAEGRLDEFRRRLLRLMSAVAAVAAIWSVASAVLGPAVVSRFFGAAYRLGALDMGLLAAGSGLYMVALGLVQGAIALGGHRLVPVVWLVGMVGFLSTVAGLGAVSGLGAALRVELGLVVGAGLALVAVALLVETRLRRLGEARRRSGRADEVVLDAGR